MIPENTLPYSNLSTSRAAAASVADTVADKESAVLMAITAAGTRGMTCDEIEELTGFTHQTASARVNGLARKGKIAPSGNTRPTRSHRSAIVWVVMALSAHRDAGKSCRSRKDLEALASEIRHLQRHAKPLLPALTEALKDMPAVQGSILRLIAMES